MMKIGIVTQLDPATARARVKFPEDDTFTETEEPGIESYWLQVTHRWTTETKEFSMPAVGSQVVCLMDENLEFGVILAGLYSDADPRPAAPNTSVHLEFSDGTILEYDPAAHLLKADVQGDVEVTATGAATIKAAGITLDGPVTITETLTVDGDSTLTGKVECMDTLEVTSTATASQFTAGVISLTTHKHPTAAVGPPSMPIP